MGQGGSGAGQHGGQGSPAAPRRAAGAPGPAQEQPAACACGIARRPQRRGGVPGSMAPELKRKGDGEDEGSVGKLTAHSNRTEEGRKVEFDGRGRRSERPSMAAGGEVVDSAEESSNGFGEGAEEVRGEVVRLWTPGIEVGWRGAAGIDAGDGSAHAQLDPRARGRRRGGGESRKEILTAFDSDFRFSSKVKFEFLKKVLGCPIHA